MDKLLAMSDGSITTLTDKEIEDFDHAGCTCEDCLFERVSDILDYILDDMVADKVFALLDDIFSDED